MPRNWKRNRQRFRTLTTDEESKYLPQHRRPYQESNDTCQKCGRNLELYTYRTGPLCQICSRDNKNWRNEFQPPDAKIYFEPRPDPINNYLERHQMPNFQDNDHYFDQEKCAYPDTWQRRIYFSDAEKSSDSFNSYGLTHDYQYQSQPQRTISYRSLNDTHPPFPPYQTNSNYELSNVPSSSYPNHLRGEQHKRKRGPEDVPSKRMKVSPYESTSQFCQYNQLSQNIMMYFHDNIQTDEIFTKKMALRSRLQQIIQKKFSGFDVFVFGSSVTGFATKTSDIDVSLIFHDTKIVKSRVFGILWDLRTLFARHHDFKKMQVIRAKVSILKFQDSVSGFEIDLNINNPTGIRNSQLLRSYARLDDRVQPLVLAVKFWAREHDINDAKSGTLSSYCLGLMLIHYLQCGCKPPVLPSLQVLQPDMYSPNSDVSSLKLDEIIPDFVSANNENVGQLFAGFLRYYAEQFNYKEKRISIRLGRLVPRVDKILTKEKNLRHWIDIEEPFEQVNTARAVNNPKKGAFIKSVFDYSCDSILQRGFLGLM